jgi:hypothetical protein
MEAFPLVNCFNKLEGNSAVEPNQDHLSRNLKGTEIASGQQK